MQHVYHKMHRTVKLLPIFTANIQNPPPTMYKPGYWYFVLVQLWGTNNRMWGKVLVLKVMFKSNVFIESYCVQVLYR